MIIKVTRWTGETFEIETANMALAVIREYPEFATEDQTENGWVSWDEPAERYGDAPKVWVYNVHGDLCTTFETIAE